MSLKFKPGDRVRVAGHPSGSYTPRSPLVGQVEQAFDEILPYYIIRLDEPLQMDEGYGREILRHIREDEDNLEAE